MSAPVVEVESYGPVSALRQGRRMLGLGRPWMSVRSYAVDGLLIDAGLASSEGHVVEFARRHSVRRAVITHHHEDHSGNARAMLDAGVAVEASSATAALVRRGFGIRLYQHMMWGAAPRANVSVFAANVVETERHRFEVIEAPGHCDDQVVLYERAEGWLFSGDAFLASRIKYFRADEDFAATLASLRRLCALPFDALYCAHRPVVTGGKAALTKKLDQLVTLEGEVRGLYARGLSLGEIARRTLGREDLWLYLWTAGDVSRRNLVRSIVHGPVRRPDTVVE